MFSFRFHHRYAFVIGLIVIVGVMVDSLRFFLTLYLRPPFHSSANVKTQLTFHASLEEYGDLCWSELISKCNHTYLSGKRRFQHHRTTVARIANDLAFAARCSFAPTRGIFYWWVMVAVRSDRKSKGFAPLRWAVPYRPYLTPLRLFLTSKTWMDL